MCVFIRCVHQYFWDFSYFWPDWKDNRESPLLQWGKRLFCSSFMIIAGKKDPISIHNKFYLFVRFLVFSKETKNEAYVFQEKCRRLRQKRRRYRGS